MGSTHLVKGLDYALLEKVRRGEDVMGEEEEQGGEEEEDVEGRLEKALEMEVVAVERKGEKKKGVQAPPAPKSRTEILAALKESRRAAREAAMPVLGAKFKKIGGPKEKVKEKVVEREKVKYVTLPDGRVKKMVKREKPKKVELEAPEPTSAPLGMMPPPPKPTAVVEEEDDDDIFTGVGAEYDPLAGLQDDDDSSTDEEGEAPETKKLKPENEENTPSTSPPAEPPMPPPPPRPKLNYFNEPDTPTSDTYKPPTASSLLSDPTLAAALAKASLLKPLSSSSSSSSADAEKAKRHAVLLESADRDAFDIDFGFGGSRDFGDEDDDDGYQMKKGGGAKRKRGGGVKKVKKGDKDDAGIVGKIVEERYGKGKK